MPKISYTPKEGFDRAEVTAEQIEQKIAEIQALLRGMIDDDNLLAYDGDFEPININPAVVKDIALDTNPVNHCMKFFGFVEQDDSIVTKLYDELMDFSENNPAMATIGGIQDTEMIWSYDQGTVDSGEYEGNKFKNITGTLLKRYEIPVNYVPMTWGELWEHIKDFEIKSNNLIVYGKIATLSAFLDDFNVKKNEYVSFFQTNRVGTETDYDEEEGGKYTEYRFDSVELPFLNYNEADNECLWSARLQIRYINEGGFVMVRFIPSVLCKVLP